MGILSTDLADHLVEKYNIYHFRKAYLLTAKIVNFAEQNNKLDELKL